MSETEPIQYPLVSDLSPASKFYGMLYVSVLLLLAVFVWAIQGTTAPILLLLLYVIVYTVLLRWQEVAITKDYIEFRYRNGPVIKKFKRVLIKGFVDSKFSGKKTTHYLHCFSKEGNFVINDRAMSNFETLRTEVIKGLPNREEEIPKIKMRRYLYILWLLILMALLFFFVQTTYLNYYFIFLGLLPFYSIVKLAIFPYK